MHLACLSGNLDMVKLIHKQVLISMIGAYITADIKISSYLTVNFINKFYVFIFYDNIFKKTFHFIAAYGHFFA